MQSSYQRFAKDVLVIGVANVLAGLSGIIFLPLITKTLGAHDYGIWAQVQVTIGLALGLVGLGLPYAMTRFLPAKTNEEEIQEEFYSVLCLVFVATLVVSAILIACADFIAGAFFGGATNVVRITGFIILVWSLDSVFLALFRAFRQMKRYSVFMIANTYGLIGVIAYLVLNGYGILSMVLALLGVRAVIFFTVFFVIKSQIGVKKPRFSRIREYLSFGLPTIPGNMSAWVVASSDRYVIGYFLGATSVGIYSAGYALGSLISLAIGVLGLVLPPTLSKLYDEGKLNEVKTHLSYSLKYLLAVAIPFVFGAAILAKPVLRLFSTPEISNQGYFVVSLVALACLFWAVGMMPTYVLSLVKKTRIIGIAWTIAALVNLLLNITIVPRIGIVGAAITTLIAYLLALGIRWHYASKEFRFPIDWRFIFKSLIASVTMSLAIWFMSPQETSATIIAVVAGAAIYGVTLILLKGFNKDEFAFFRELLQRK